MIITGAPIEHLEFEEVTYWNDIKKLWTGQHIRYLNFIYLLGSPGRFISFLQYSKYKLPSKMFGVFKHKVHNPTLPL